jgi:hypothetical protein
MSKATIEVKQDSVRKVFDELLSKYKLTEMEISLLCGIQGLLIERLIKDKKLTKL